MSTVTHEIALLLEEDGFGAIGETIFVDQDQPPKPDRIIQVVNSGTISSNFPSITLSYPAIQIIVRGGRGEHQLCEQSIEDITLSIHQIANRTVLESRYVYINQLSGPISLGMDITMRPSYSVNFVGLRTSI